jgi:TRAP-type C4-dicarboxylate transport system substrate-binding protein
MRITRRSAAASLLAAAACAPEGAPGELQGRAVSFTPPRSPWDEQWDVFKANVARNPTIAMRYYNRGETGGEEQQLFDLRRGRAMVGGPSLQGLASVVPELTIAMTPYLFDSEAEVDFVYDLYLFDVFRPLFAAKGLHLLQWVEVGWTNLFSNAPIIHPKDAEGLKLRGSPNRAAQEFLRAIGADSVPLASVDIVPSLQTGLIQGGLGATVFHYFSTRSYATDFTLTRHSYDTGAIVANLAWYEGATADQRATLDHAWMPSAEARASVRRLTATALDQMAQEGIRIHDLDAELRAEWAAATAGVAERLITLVGGQSLAVFEAILKGKAAFAAAGSGP